MVGTALVFGIVWGLGVALAEDDVDEMLNAIPEIESPEPVELEKPDSVEPQGMDLDGYMRACRQAVYAHFKPPKGVIKQQRDVEVTFVVAVDADGSIIKLSVPKSSGFKSFDAAALKAINKAGSLPPPPERWNPRQDKVLLPFNADAVKSH